MYFEKINVAGHYSWQKGMNMPIVSIVVPIYKVEQYLPRCIESIKRQTLTDIEIILVDDGSPDNSPRMCDEYAKEDKRIRVVHKKNGGLSSARNAGLAIAKGKYVGFVDADDSIKASMYEELLEVIQREKVDFVMADYTRILSDGTSYSKSASIRGGRYDKKNLQSEIFPALIMGKDIEYGPLLSVWHCLYNTDFLKNNNIWFDEEVRWSEDNIFSAIVGYCADSFYYLKDHALYNYYQNEGTITTSYRPGAWDVYCVMNKHLEAYFGKSLIYDFSQQLKWHMLYYSCVCIGQAFSENRGIRKEIVHKILLSDELNKAFDQLDYSGVSIKLRVQFFLMKHKYYLLLEKMYLRRKK